jgi:hypothetical protein
MIKRLAIEGFMLDAEKIHALLHAALSEVIRPKISG